jgi:hypothetical protein
MSGPVGVGGFEEGEFEGDSPTEKVAAQVLLRGADAVQLPAQEIDEAAKIRIVVQHDPLGVHEVFRPWLRILIFFSLARACARATKKTQQIAAAINVNPKSFCHGPDA